jgi:hypothetical protein
MIKCGPHGRFREDYCSKYEVDEPAGVGWVANTTCECDRGWTGTDCTIAAGPEACTNATANMTVFDNAFVNAIAPKHLECFVYYDKQTYYPLHDHRVTVEIDLPRESIHWTLYSRTHNIDHWDTVIPIIWCDLTQCSGQTAPDDPKWQVEYQCNAINCSACTTDQGCEGAIGIIVAGMTPPMSAKSVPTIPFPSHTRALLHCCRALAAQPLFPLRTLTARVPLLFCVCACVRRAV